MEAVGTGPGRDVNERRCLPAEFRRVHRLLNFEFLDGVYRRIDHQIVEQLVGDFDAIEQVYVVTRSLPSHVGHRAGLLKRVSTCAARRQNDAVAQLRKREEVSLVQRNLHDLAILDNVADFRRRRLAPGSLVLRSPHRRLDALGK